jgi:hypothetical protein
MIDEEMQPMKKPTTTMAIAPSPAVEMIPYDTHRAVAVAMPAPAPTHPVAGYLAKWQALHQAAAARAFGSGVATAKLIAEGRGAEVLSEILAIQTAVRKELEQQAQAWVKGLEAWTQQWAQTGGANSMASLVTQEGDLATRFSNLLSAQMTDFVELMEGLTVGYGFWVQQASSRAGVKGGRLFGLEGGRRVRTP